MQARVQSALALLDIAFVHSEHARACRIVKLPYVRELRVSS